jgi:DNA-binding transcriptional regulator YdaS (Cro superfamily)
MNLNQWLDGEAGRTTKIASHFGRTKGAITQWRTNGVPVGLMKAVRDFTNGEVSLEEMVPDVMATEPEKEAA